MLFQAIFFTSQNPFISNLESLFLYSLLFFLGFTVLYFICKPIVTLLMRLHTTLLLNYLVTSFLFFLILFTLSYFLPIEGMSDRIYPSLFISLLSFASFLIVRRIYLQIIRR